MNKYVKVMLTTFVVAVIVIPSVTYLVKFKLKASVYYSHLIRYQIDKIESGDDYDTIFIGDSSLGNSINVNAIDDILGTRSVNLALTGIYGYIGSYNMLKRVHKYNKNIKNIVLVHTLDMLARDVDYKSHMITSMNYFTDDIPEKMKIQTAKCILLEMFDGGFYMKFKNYRSIIRASLNLFFPYGWGTQVVYNDYHVQREPLAEREDLLSINYAVAPRVVPEKVEILHLIKDYCDRNGLNCLYVVGPLYQGVRKNSSEMIQQTRKVVAEDVGMAFVEGAPLSIPPGKLGDSVDHVAYDYKNEYTERYAKLLDSYLR